MKKYIPHTALIFLIFILALSLPGILRAQPQGGGIYRVNSNDTQMIDAHGEGGFVGRGEAKEKTITSPQLPSGTYSATVTPEWWQYDKPTRYYNIEAELIDCD